MEMNLEKPELDTQLINQLDNEGYIILKNFFDKEYVDALKKGAENIFKIQFNRFGYTSSFQENMIKLFNEHEDIFINCGKITNFSEKSHYSSKQTYKAIFKACVSMGAKIFCRTHSKSTPSVNCFEIDVNFEHFVMSE